MTWQEYQNAVGLLYQNMDSIGIVKHNVYLPDRITGQKRQIDTWLEVNAGGHQVNILIDAKFRKSKIDVKDVEEVEALGNSVKAHKIVIVTSMGWTEPAYEKAKFSNNDLRILTVEDALDLLLPNKWFMCYHCEDECVVMDNDGVLFRENSGLFFDWYAGKCRKCGDTYFHCPECGNRKILEDGDKYKCSCKHKWKKDGEKLLIKFNDLKNYQRIDNSPAVPIEFLYWMTGYDRPYWAKLVLSLLNIPTDKGNVHSFMIHPFTGKPVKPHFVDGEPVFYFGLDNGL